MFAAVANVRDLSAKTGRKGAPSNSNSNSVIVIVTVTVIVIVIVIVVVIVIVIVIVIVVVTVIVIVGSRGYRDPLQSVLITSTRKISNRGSQIPYPNT